LVRMEREGDLTDMERLSVSVLRYSPVTNRTGNTFGN